MKEKGKIKLGISIGDLNGIGCEVALKTFQDSRMLEFCTPVLFASNKSVSFQKNHLKIELGFNGVKIAAQAIDGKINVVNVWNESPKTVFGQATPEAGNYAIKSLKAAVTALKNGEVDVLVGFGAKTNVRVVGVLLVGEVSDGEGNEFRAGGVSFIRGLTGACEEQNEGQPKGSIFHGANLRKSPY